MSFHALSLMLGFLLDSNLACAAREKAGESVTPPGLPLFVAATPEERAGYVSDDCVRV